MRIHGIDFTSAPRPRKPIVVASGTTDPDGGGGCALRITSLERLPTFDAFEAFLARPGPWVGGFDLPFGLPREFVAACGWPADWAWVLRQAAALPVADLVALCRRFCDARPVGQKFAHRATDRPAGSSPSMKWVNPPVLLMYRAGAPRLVAAGLTLPGLAAGDPHRLALEAYPGQLARLLGGRASYKSDSAAMWTLSRRDRRVAIVDALMQQMPLQIAVHLEPAIREACIDDGTGDALDAVLCAVQAAWGWRHRERHYGLPPWLDPLEGWIVATPWPGGPL